MMIERADVGDIRDMEVYDIGSVVQTMNYDSSNRFSSVVDSFGHQLTFSYDAQGHLSAVTRQ